MIEIRFVLFCFVGLLCIKMDCLSRFGCLTKEPILSNIFFFRNNGVPFMKLSRYKLSESPMHFKAFNTRSKWNLFYECISWRRYQEQLKNRRNESHIRMSSGKILDGYFGLKYLHLYSGSVGKFI